MRALECRAHWRASRGPREAAAGGVRRLYVEARRRPRTTGGDVSWPGTRLVLIRSRAIVRPPGGAMAEEWPRIDLTKLKTYPLRSRLSKVQAADLGRAWTPGGRLTEFLERLPRILAGSDFRAVVSAILAARRRG